MKPLSYVQRRCGAAAMDLIGQRFGRLTVIARSFENPVVWKPKWECLCDCGSKTVVRSECLRRETTRSCGCLGQETKYLNGKRMKRHGMSGTQIYYVWFGMKRRCLDSKQKDYERYGGRGIKVCDRWLASFENFLADVGLRPSPDYSIDRIDNDGNYEPGNVRWATLSEQRNNRRPASTWRGRPVKRLEVSQ